MAKKASRNLAVSDSDSDTADSSAPLAERRVASASSQGNGKGKERQRKQRKTSHNDHDDETDEESLLENDRAGLSSEMSKRKGKSKADQNGKAKGTQAKGGRRKALAVDQDDSDTEMDDDAADGSDSADDGYTTMSIGSLHDADSEDGLGEWTEDDGKKYQMEEFPEPDFIQPKSSDGSDGSFEVDIVIRFRWHPRRHFPQYRVKWTGYSDVFNLWEPVDSFAGGNAVEEYWKDIEHAGLQKRPKGWDKGLDSSSDAGLDSDDTERAVTSQDANKRKEARRRKRRDIRIDRVEMRKAYSRKHARKKYEEDLKTKRIEQKRRKKEQEEAAAAAKKTPVKTVVNPAKVVKSLEPSRSYAASTSNGKSAESVKLTTNGISNGMQSGPPRPQQQQQPSRPLLASASASSPPAASLPSSSSVSDSLAIARAYMTESDAKLRADKKKAKLDEAIRKGHLSISPSSSEAELSKAAASNASASTSAVGATEEKTKGAFRGAHKNLKKIKTIEPGKPSALAGKRWDPLSHLLQGSTPASASAPQLTASQEAMPPPTSVPVTNSDRNGMRPVNNATAEQTLPSIPVPAASPITPSYASFRPVNALRNGPLRMGNDPRSSRPMARPAVHDDMSYTNGNTSPATGADKSPQHSTQSPMHSNQAAPSPVHVPPSPLHSGQGQPASPLHHTKAPQGDASRKQNGVPEGYIDPATIKGLSEIEQARALDAMKRWHFPDSLRKESEMSYNFQPRYQNEDQDRRRLMQHIISICKGGRPPNLLPRHMQPGKKNIVWIPSAKYPLSAMERDVLPLNNFKFIEYTEETGVLEIWPFTSRKIIMCTFGALMLKLIEHCYVVKSKQRWEVQDATIMIHPWQKAILQQLIDADMLRSFLEQILGITDDLANKEFAISESGREVLDDFEEVPSEYLNSEATGRDEPLVSELDMSDIILNVDKETYTTLHRLQYEKRQHCRFFTLIMAKTRVACSEVPTLYKVVQ